MPVQLLIIAIFIGSCNHATDEKIKSTAEGHVYSTEFKIIDPTGTTIETRFNTPENFQRTKEDPHSFGNYLRNLPLKAHGTQVRLYDGGIKLNDDIYDAVVDLPIGNKNLHQCADAVMRLRAEYLYRENQFDKIHFNFTNGFRVDYSKWMEGNRIVVNGNRTNWKLSAQPSNNYENFWSYMEIIFNYAGTLSLAKELNPVDVSDLKAGDVFIVGGSPGHAVIVVDVAINPRTNKKIFLLAQSYMPAQEIQILKNRNNPEISPWYYADFESLNTPEWLFEKSHLKRFEYFEFYNKL